MTLHTDNAMGCLYCAADGERVPAVGVCAECQCGVCSDHAKLVHVPTFVKTAGGIGGPYRRAARDRRRLMCTDCAQTGPGGPAPIYLDTGEA